VVRLPARGCVPNRSVSNSRFLVFVFRTGIVKYWEPSMNNVKAGPAHKESVRDISFGPTDLKFATCSDDQTIRC
jgi:polyadenylation factor subunit 2